MTAVMTRQPRICWSIRWHWTHEHMNLGYEYRMGTHGWSMVDSDGVIDGILLMVSMRLETHIHGTWTWRQNGCAWMDVGEQNELTMLPTVFGGHARTLSNVCAPTGR